MNISATIGLRFGGPGSGRHPEFKDVVDKNYENDVPKEGLSHIEYKTVPAQWIENQNMEPMTVTVKKWERRIDKEEKLPALIVAPQGQLGKKDYFLMDGHHRLEALGNKGHDAVRVGIMHPKDGYGWQRHVDINTRSIWYELEKKK